MAKIESDLYYTFDDVLIKPQYSSVRSREDVDISVEIVKGLKLDIPLMSANMQSVNSVNLATKLYQLGGLATIDQFRCIEEEVAMIKEVKKNKAMVAGAIGTTRDFLDRAKELIKAKVDLIVMDTPHAHNLLTRDAIRSFRKLYPKFPLIVGNIATKEAAIFLIEQGVDGIKVGIGPGAACLTRVNAGVGVPQVTAIMEVFDVTRHYNVSLIADGGVKTPGSIAKAIASGGSSIYMGSVFAGTDESPGEVVEINGKKFKEYFGSSSTEAKVRRAKSDKNFKQSASRFVEGESGFTKYQGSLEDVVERYTMGLKSAMSYTGAKTIKEFQDKAILTVLTQNGLIENGAHGLV